MKVGTKSVLFGAHAFYIHPWFVALAWWKLYGFPKDFRLWCAFFLHDLGYWGKRNMDGSDEGETHPEWAARVMQRWFDEKPDRNCHFCYGDISYISRDSMGTYSGRCGQCHYRQFRWHDFCLYHSRFYAKRDGRRFSQLCVADKLAVALEPWWLYLPRVIASGEVWEYMGHAEHGKYRQMHISTRSIWSWYRDVMSYLRRWVVEHQDGRDDTWTTYDAT